MNDREAAVQLRIAMAPPMSARKTRMYALVVRRFHRAGCNCVTVDAHPYGPHHWACGVNRAA